jgi:Tfp pilus assembly protein PilF
MRRTFCMLPSLLLAWTFAQPAVAQIDADQQLGSVHFKTSCNDVAQRRFDLAMRYQHSYWYLPAKEIFEEVLKADPTCAMAHWGIALTLLDNPHNAIKPTLPQALRPLRRPRQWAPRPSASAITLTHCG